MGLLAADMVEPDVLTELCRCAEREKGCYKRTIVVILMSERTAWKLR